MVSACRSCHADESEISLQASVDAWWGATRPHDPASAGLLALTDGMGEDLAARLLLHPDAPGDMDRFRALARFALGWLSPGEPLRAEASARIVRLASADDPDVRALALAVLHAADPAHLPDLEVAIAGESPAVRRRWVMILGFLSEEAAAREETGVAMELLVKALAVILGDAAILRSLGLLHSRDGNHAAAIQRFTESLKADAGQPLVHVNRGIAHAAAGDPGAAVRDYQAATALNPYEPLAHFNLGNAYLRADNLAEAIAAYERAVAAGPDLARAHVNLAIALARAGRIEEALARARTGAAFAPGDAVAQQVLSQLEAAAGGNRGD